MAGSGWNDPGERLRRLVARDIGGKPFSELSSVAFDHDGPVLAGHALLDALEDAGYSVDDFDAVGALTAAAVPFVVAMIDAAASRGQKLDGFSLDFVYPGVKGPSIAGKRVVLLDAWLSDLSYIQTSSIVTLTESNELDLDFGVVSREDAQVLAVASLVAGGSGEPPSTVRIVDPVSRRESELPFVHVFSSVDVKTAAAAQGDVGINGEREESDGARV